MKKVLTVFLAVMGMNAMAQESLVKLSPFHFGDATFYTSYEKALEDNKSINLSAGVRLADNGDDYGWMGELQLRKYLFKLNTPAFTDGALSGVYAGMYANGKYFKEYDEWQVHVWDVEPYYDYVYTEEGYVDWEQTTYFEGEYHEETEMNDYDIKQMEAGVLMGVQAVVNDVLSLDFFFGGGLRASIREGRMDSYYEPYISEKGATGVTPKIGFDIGIAF